MMTIKNLRCLLVSGVIASCSMFTGTISAATPEYLGAIQNVKPQVVGSAGIAPPQKVTLPAQFISNGVRVAGETPQLQIVLRTSPIEQVNSSLARDDIAMSKSNNPRASHSLLKQLYQSPNLPYANTITADMLVNQFEFADEYAFEVFADDCFSVFSELAPSPYNHGAYLLMLVVKANGDGLYACSNNGQLPLTLNFNPNVISEFRMIGYNPIDQRNLNARTSYQQQRQAVTTQAIIFIELRRNELGYLQPRPRAKYELHQQSTGANSTVQPYENTALHRQVQDIFAKLTLPSKQNSNSVMLSLEMMHSGRHQASETWLFYAAVAGWVQLINQNVYLHHFDYANLIELAQQGMATEQNDDKNAFYQWLVKHKDKFKQRN
ncbi:YfbK domain-containing protein [Shewanella maritima]|uniref:YfbK domain-containing protein n=1 Tax=Shewanella maritima TaxID=2520507 RepID=UPI003734CCA1